jgi:hypothetical protein
VPAIVGSALLAGRVWDVLGQQPSPERRHGAEYVGKSEVKETATEPQDGPVVLPYVYSDSPNDAGPNAAPQYAMVITGCFLSGRFGEPRGGQPDFRFDHASVEPRRGRAMASGTIWVSQPEGGKKHPSQPTVALGTLWAADPVGFHKSA